MSETINSLKVAVKSGKVVFGLKQTLQGIEKRLRETCGDLCKRSKGTRAKSRASLKERRGKNLPISWKWLGSCISVFA